MAREAKYGICRSRDCIARGGIYFPAQMFWKICANGRKKKINSKLLKNYYSNEIKYSTAMFVVLNMKRNYKSFFLDHISTRKMKNENTVIDKCELNICNKQTGEKKHICCISALQPRSGKRSEDLWSRSVANFKIDGSVLRWATFANGGERV